MPLKPDTNRAPLVARVAGALLALGLVVAYLFMAQGHSPLAGPPGPDEAPAPRVERLLDGIDEDASRVPPEKEKKGDSPTAGASKRIEFTAVRGRVSRLGTIQIPKIGLDVGFFSGVGEGVLQRGPGHWPGTPVPTNPGNAVLSGHRTTYTHPFGDLDLLTRGDAVKVAINKKQRATFRVTRTSIVPESDYVEFVLSQPKNPGVRMITLFACHPKGYRTHRIVVQAKAVT